MPPRVILEPLDGDSQQHAQRLHDMVEEMGWSQRTTPGVIQDVRDGKRALYWITIDPKDPDYDSIMNKVKAASDMYKAPLLSRDPTPESATFTPIGHIGLKLSPLTPAPPVSEHNITVAGFYVTRTLQASGIGSAALEALAQIAKAPPLNAKALVLYVLSKETVDQEGLYRLIGQPMQVSKEDWYGRRGFVRYEMVRTPEYDLGEERVWDVLWAYMWREL